MSKKKKKEKKQEEFKPLKKCVEFIKSHDFFGIEIPPFNIKG